MGVRVVEVSTLAEFEAALGPRAAMIYILAGPSADNSPLNVKRSRRIAKAGGPDPRRCGGRDPHHPERAPAERRTLVAYSGGKCLRGPQTAGLLLGRKDLVRAAWVHSAPHHGVTRSLKVGKEDAIGMLMAVEMWVKRDHEAEWKRWNGWLDHISQRVSTVSGVTTSVSQPNGLSNRTPSLRIVWDRQKIGIAGDAVARLLFETEPRITLDARAGGQGQTGVSVTPYMMAPGDENIIADRLVAVLSKPPQRRDTPATPTTDVTGQWNVRIQYAAATSNQRLDTEGERSRRLPSGGVHDARDTGTLDGDAIRIRSASANSMAIPSTSRSPER